MVDYSNLFGPLYRAYATTVVITPESSGALPVAMRAIDKTRGVVVPLGKNGEVSVPTTRPAAQVLASDLAGAGLSRADLIKASLLMNGKTWRVERTMPKPTTGGEAEDQLWLILTEV